MKTSPAPVSFLRKAHLSPNTPSATLHVDMAGTMVEIRVAQPGLFVALRDRYGPFLAPGSRADLLLVQSGGGHVPPNRARRAPVHEFPGDASPGLVDGLIRTLLPELVAPSLLAHGTLLTDGRACFLCCGVSGSGKSTLAALLPERALCDELALVRPAAAGFDGVALPYWNARPGHAPLAAIHILEHGRRHRKTRLEAGDAIRQLRRHIYWPDASADAMTAVFRTLARLVEAVPTYRLAFCRDAGVWDVITGTAP